MCAANGKCEPGEAPESMPLSTDLSGLACPCLKKRPARLPRPVAQRSRGKERCRGLYGVLIESSCVL